MIFSPQNEIRKILEPDRPPRLSQLPQVDSNWSPELQNLEGHEDPVSRVIFSPDGRLLASASSRSVRLWDHATSTLLQSFQSDRESDYLDPGRYNMHYYEPLVFSADSQLLAVVSHGGTVSIWDSAIETLRDHHQLRIAGVQKMKFSPDSQVLASVSVKGIIYLHNLETGAVTDQFQGYYGRALHRVFSPVGLVLASGFQDGTVEVADIRRGRITTRLYGCSHHAHPHHAHSHPVDSLEFAPNGRFLASLSLRERVVRLWNTVTGILQCEIDTVTELPSRRLVFSPNSLTLAFSTRLTIQFWDVWTGARHRVLDEPVPPDTRGRIYTLREMAFSSDGSFLVSAGSKAGISLWDCHTGKRKHAYDTHLTLICSAALSPNNQTMLLASGGEDGIVRLWDLAALEGLSQESNEIEDMIFSHDGQLLVSRSAKGLQVWDTLSGLQKSTLKNDYYDESEVKKRHGMISAMVFSPDNRLMALMDRDRVEILLWDAKEGTLKRKLESDLLVLPKQGSPCFSLAFAPNGLLASSVNDEVILWNHITGAQLQHWTAVGGDVTTLEFFEGEPCSETNLNPSPRKTDEEVHLRTNFGPLKPGMDIFSLNPLHVKLLTSAKRVGFRKRFSSMAIKPREGDTIESRNLERVDGETVEVGSGVEDCASLQISLENNQWITLNGEKTVWLPPEFRPQMGCRFKTQVRSNGAVIALGLRSGDVSFIGFRNDKQLWVL